MDTQAGLVTARERPTGYGTVAKWFHWVTAVLLLVALAIGPVIGHIKDSDKMAFYAIHESAGLTVLFVAVLRLLWRQANPPPPHPAIPRWMGRGANAVHLALYALLIVQPVLGFLATNAWGFPMQGATAYLGFIEFPRFTEANVPVATGLSQAHAVVGYALLALLVVHLAGALFHQAVRRDDTLLRMV